jgi:predicted TIM-barrel fold metal-dependent hydrolase
MDFFRGNNPEGRSRKDFGVAMRAIPAFREPEPRLAVLDELGIDATLLFPTLASVLEVNMMDKPDLALAAIHALNQWMHEQWTFDYRHRIYACPVVNLSTCEGGVAELEWVVERGAKLVLVRPAPVGGWQGSRSPFLDEFDPFWARVQETGTLVVLHTSDSGYQRHVNEWEGGQREFLPFHPTAFSLLCVGRRPIMDSIFSAIAHGMCSRFPGVRLASVENGSDWVRRVLEDLELMAHKMPQDFSEDPVEVFRRQVWVNPFWEDPVDELAELIGVERILFGSDWPHPEGLADPVSWADHCAKAGFGRGDIARMMGGNLAELLGVPLVAAASA